MKRSLVSLLALMTFLVVTISGVVAFLIGFNLKVIGLHALMGMIFVFVIGFHAANNFGPLKRYLKQRDLFVSLFLSLSLSLLFWWQPAPIRFILNLSQNLGPALDRFELRDDGMVFQYSPDPGYKMKLTIRMADSFDPAHPPYMAIWLENQGAYHIKTLLAPEDKALSATQLPYWTAKRQGWEKAKQQAKQASEKQAVVEANDQEVAEIDAISQPTPNGSFDPADYILPSRTARQDESELGPYKLLIEINVPNDSHKDLKDQPSLVYAVQIDNEDPRTYQLLELVGYPEREGEDKASWELYYVDERFGSALNLIDSALLVIER